MIGYYIHHHGRGHLSRATAIAREMTEPVTGLSSLSRPADWPGAWVQLPLDDAPSPCDPDAAPCDPDTGPCDPDAGGRLHWVPLGSTGLRTRMAVIAGWLDAAAPRAVVVDISVEVCLLVRLHGIPVVAFALPGHRDDPAHQLGFDVATTVLGAWPSEANAGMVTGASERTLARIIPVGGISRFAPVSDDSSARAERPPRVLVLSGAGGDSFSAAALQRARSATPEWEWTQIGGSADAWVPDPWTRILDADVVVTHAGQSAVAEVAAARRAAVIIPQDRPHGEQRATASVLERDPWPAVVVPEMPAKGWPTLLDRARGLDTDAWRTWNDGEGAARAAWHITRTADTAARL